MRTRLYVLAAFSLGLAGCNYAGSRIAEHPAEFAALNPATQRNIRRGIVQPGYSTDMVYMALGSPSQMTVTSNSDVVWLYRETPTTAPNETIRDGFRQRVVYDPVKRTEDVITEPIDTRAFPNLVPHTLRLTFHDGKVTTVERIKKSDP